MRGALVLTSQCVFAACQAGPQAGKYCGGGTGSVSCTSTANQSGYKIRISGNENGAEWYGGAIVYLLRGDGMTSDGCVIECDVTLGADGSVNTSGLTSCTQSGDCLNTPIETIHSVVLLDPDGQILGIPGVGPAQSGSFSQQGDPALRGDCVRVPSNTPCP